MFPSALARIPRAALFAAYISAHASAGTVAPAWSRLPTVALASAKRFNASSRSGAAGRWPFRFHRRGRKLAPESFRLRFGAIRSLPRGPMFHGPGVLRGLRDTNRTNLQTLNCEIHPIRQFHCQQLRPNAYLPMTFQCRTAMR